MAMAAGPDPAMRIDLEQEFVETGIGEVLSQLEGTKAAFTIVVGAHALRLTHLDRAYWPAVAAVFLVAFGLRLFRLDAAIYQALLGFADGQPTWAGVETLVAFCAEWEQRRRTLDFDTDGERNPQDIEDAAGAPDAEDYPDTWHQDGLRLRLTYQFEPGSDADGVTVDWASAEEMRRDEDVFVMGEDVGLIGGIFQVTRGLRDEFGEERVIDTPISEPGYAGIGVGAAMTGMRPVVDVMFGDFITLAMDQIVNQAAKVHYMSGGKLKVPIVFRTTLGATRRSAAQHSQSLHAWVSHIPGLKVALPSVPYEAKGLMKTAIRDDSPVVIFEDKMMYRVKGPVPAEDYTIPFGVAEVKRPGTDVTIVATSSMVQVALAAAEQLAPSGIGAEVVDVRTTMPLDKQTLIGSARKTGRALIIDEGYESYGVTGEIASVIAEGAEQSAKPIMRQRQLGKSSEKFLILETACGE